MKYILTMWNENSPDYGTSLWHSQYGTGTLICPSRAMAMSVTERYMFGYQFMVRIDINFRDDDGELQGWTTYLRDQGYVGTHNFFED